MKELPFDKNQNELIVAALKSSKVRDIIFLEYIFGRHEPGFDPETSKLALVIEFENEVDFEGTIAKGEKTLVLVTNYLALPSITENPHVLKVDLCDENILEILRSSDSDEIELTTPWSGPVGDEWDSPGYDSFWAGAEQNFNEKYRFLTKLGKKVKIVSPKSP